MRGGLQGVPGAQGLQVQGEKFAEHFRRHPLAHGQAARCVMVAGNQAPQGPVDDHRNGHRGAHAHVAQVLAVDRRDAAQVRVGEVQRLAGEVQDRHDGHGLEARIGNDPYRVAQVQRTGLLGDVRGREVLPQEAFQATAPGLSHHLAGAVGAKLVDHHPVIAEQGAHAPGRVLDQLVRALDLAQLGDHRAHQLHRLGDARAGGLELEDDRAFVDVRRHVERLARGDHHAERQRRARGLLDPCQRVAQGVRGFAADHCLQALAIELAGDAEHGLAVGRMAQDDAGRGVAGQEAAVRLDAARNLDGFAVTVGQVDLR